MSSRRSSRTAMALLTGAVALSACEALLTDPRPAADVGLSFQITGGAPGGGAAAFSRVRRVALRFVRPDETFRDTIVPALPVDGEVRAAVSIPVGERSEALGVLARLGYADTNLFQGAAVVRLDPGSPATVNVPLSPIPGAVVADRAQVTLQGVGSSTLLSSAVLFASGDTIEALFGSWSSADPAIVAVDPLGVALAQGTGQTLLEVRLDTLADTVLVDVVPATPTGGRVAWTNAAGGSWSIGSNWSGGSVPQAGDSVEISLDGTYTVTLEGPPFSTPAALRVGGGSGAQSLSVTGLTLTSLADVTVTGSGRLRLDGATLSAPVVRVDAGGVMELGQAATVSADMTHAGLLLVAEGVAGLTGSLATSPTSTIRIGGGTFVSQLTTSGGFTNDGLIELYNGGRLATATGALVNAPSGGIVTLTGPIAGDASIDGVLDNRGTVTLSEPLRLTASGAAHLNSGTIVVNTGGPLGLLVAGADGFDNQGVLDASNGGAWMPLSGVGGGFSSSGTTTIGAGYGIEIGNGPFSAVPGAIGGAGSLFLRDLGGGFSAPVSLGSTGPAHVTLTNATLTGGDVTVPPGASLTVDGGVVAVGLDLQGGRLFSIGVGGSADGRLTVSSGSTVTIEAGPTGDNTLAVATGFTSNGSIQLFNSGAGRVARLTVGGTLVNVAPGSIDTFAGAGGATHVIAATVQNAGAISLFADLWIQGQLVDPAGAPSAYLGNGGTLIVSDVSADGAVFDGMPLAVDGGLTQLDNVTFQNMDPTGVQLAIDHPGAAGPVTLLGASFTTTPTTGRYLSVTDSDGVVPLLVVEVLGASPASGFALSDVFGGATLIW